MHRNTDAAQRLLMALDLFRDGEALMRQNLRRRHPSASAAEIERELVSWIRRRPGTIAGDGSGRPHNLPR
ncbi:MAG: hypothetical protein P8J30_00405 [Ilumatobacter sp.]|nr:hypothetical protein [Ilumatobacter sp.]